MNKPLVTPGAKNIQSKNIKPKDTEEKNDENVISYKFYYGQLHGHTAYSLQPKSQPILTKEPNVVERLQGKKNEYKIRVEDFIKQIESEKRRTILTESYNTLKENIIKLKNKEEVLDPLYPHAYGFPDIAFGAAMEAGLHFLAITDHSSYNIKAFKILEKKIKKEEEKNKIKVDKNNKALDFWQDTKKIANDFNQKNYDAKTKSHKFLALAAYELTFAGNAIGHINVFNTTICMARADFKQPNNFEKLKAFYNRLNSETGAGAFAQLNHPVDQFGDFFDLKYHEDYNRKIPLIELIHVNSEPSAYDILWDVYNKALEKGWKVAPAFSPDNHHGEWGSANELRTVVLLPDKPAKLHEAFNQDNLFKAISRRRVYATDCVGLQIDFRLKEKKDKSSKNLAVMGEIIKVATNDLNLYLNVMIDEKEIEELKKFKEKKTNNKEVDKNKETANKKPAITRYEIVGRKGEVLTSGSYAGGERMIELKRKKKNDYFYLKVFLSNDKFGVTAPIWINGSEKDKKK